MPGVGFMVRVVGLGSQDPEFKSCFTVELIPGGVDSACHPSRVGKMSASLLISCVGGATRPGLCPIAKETVKAVPTLCTEYGPIGWIDGWWSLRFQGIVNCRELEYESRLVGFLLFISSFYVSPIYTQTPRCTHNVVFR